MVLMYIVAIVVIQSPFFYDRFKSKGNFEIEFISKVPDYNWMTGFATILLSYFQHIGFFYLRSEMNEISQRRLRKTVFWGTFYQT